MTLIAVLDYGIGNLRSATKALEHVGADARLTDDPLLIADAAGVVLPGVGAFGRCMEALERAKLDVVAHEAIESDKPFLGICIGMQMLYEGSDESPGVAELGALTGMVRLLPEGVKRPQMQWNTLLERRPNPLMAEMSDPAWVYFVHSYAAEMTDDVVATCEYGGPVAAAVQHGSVWATQFHPEKSSTNGLQLLTNFVAAASATGS